MQSVRDLKPAEILDTAIETGVAKSGGSFPRLLILGFLAGAFIALAGAGSNTAAFNLLLDPETFGLGKVLAGTVFTVGLIMVILTGAELFTGNVLILAAAADKRVSIGRMLRNWVIVYVGNFLGAAAIAAAIYYSGQLGGGDSMLGAFTIKTAAAKVGLGFGKAFVLGILCNWLVCIAVWISFSAGSIVGKIGAIFFPIWLFVTCGFEHSIANMYFIPTGILAKANEIFAVKSGLGTEVLENLNWTSFFVDNLIPVTLGNIVGGGVLVALVYWLVHRKA